MSATTLAARVKSRREELGLSQRDIPGIDHSAVSKIESGKLKDPGFDLAGKLSKALGLTLDELGGAPASAVRMIELRAILPDPNNPRTINAGDAEDAAFVDSIRQLGLIQPLAVRRLVADEDAKGDHEWMVVDGHRRLAGLWEIHGPKSKVLVPCRLVEADDTRTLLMQLVANVQRADMNPLDLANGVAGLVLAKMDTQEIADALGRKRRWVQEMASVGQHLVNGARNALQTGRITISQAVAIAAERDEKAQNELVTKACDGQLNEDEIRAITADRKERQREEEDAAKRSTQLDIEDFTPGKTKAKYPTPNESGIFTGKPTIRARWTDRRGEFEIELYQFGDHKWCAGSRCAWRPSSVGGGSSSTGAARDRHKQSTAALAFLDCARDYYKGMCGRAKNWPEDVPAMHKLHDWITQQLTKLGATERVLADWRKNNPPPAKPKAKKPAEKKEAARPKIEPPPIDLTKPPLWAQPMADALFCVHDGRQAFLCRGWAQMAKTFAIGADGHDLNALYARPNWQDDSDGKPFDFGSSVIRLVEAPA
jgi:ParB/RepB/Spo0J family partition protein